MKKVFLIVATAFALNFASTQMTVASAQTPVDLTYAAEKSVNSVVFIKVTINSKTQTIEGSDPFEDFFNFGPFSFGDPSSRGQRRQYQTPKRQGAGSGVILSKDGYIVTNNHVIDGADELMVKLNDNREYKARIIGADKKTDLALIKIEAKDLQPITVGNSDNLKLGEWVLAIGNPFSLTSTVTAGIVSAKARTVGGEGIESFIQTDAAINPGNSGGALVNTRGELVGINAQIYSQTGSYTGYGFAIPTSIMNKVVADLKKYGTVQRALLGFTGQDVSTYIDLQKEKGKDADLGTTKGVYLAEVSSDGAAQEGGLKAGDVITAMDGRSVTKFGELQEIMASHKPGDKVTITYIRDKRTHTATLTLRNAQGTTSLLESVDVDQLGVALRPLTTNEKEELALSNGLVVTAVRDGKMKEAGVTKGLILLQINDKVLNTPEDFNEAVKTTNMSNDRVLWIRAKTQSGINKSFTIELDNNKAKRTERRR